MNNKLNDMIEMYFDMLNVRDEVTAEYYGE